MKYKPKKLFFMNDGIMAMNLHFNQPCDINQLKQTLTRPTKVPQTTVPEPAYC
jgi:hypothetical protein